MIPVRVAEDGTLLTPSGLDPYKDTVWCEGAADTLPPSMRKKYAKKITDLKEKRAVLASRKKGQHVRPAQ